MQEYKLYRGFELRGNPLYFVHSKRRTVANLLKNDCNSKIGHLLHR